MRDVYADLMTYDGSYEYRLMKQADKICAYLKCVEERKAGSKEFLSAERSILKELEETALPETALFMSRFLPSYELTLDETEKYKYGQKSAFGIRRCVGKVCLR